MNHIESVLEVQQELVKKLSENQYFGKHDIKILSENSKNIEYEIAEAISKTGILITVETPKIEYYGDFGSDEREPFWNMPEVRVVVAESPTVNRAFSGHVTALDAALVAAQTLSKIDAVGITDIQQSEEGGILMAVLRLKTNIVFRYITDDAEPIL